MRGELRIYLGAAPGVGKTFAMLTEGHHRKSRGADVIAGVIETHERKNTEALLEGLEVVPLRSIAYRGKLLQEMDLQSILDRNPKVVLVDELAHTNVKGSKNTKRYQDVQVLLDAGISVISTLNIQHLESLNDVVFAITGVTQTETVPDLVVRQADQIELVDMTPEALRRRMVHGKIYPLERIERSLNGYFRSGNLIALRELALLWLADRVDENLMQFRSKHSVLLPWETKERFLVALAGAPNNGTLIRRASRMASRSKGDLIGLHVKNADGLIDNTGSELSRYKKLVEDLGGRYIEVVADSTIRGIMGVARAENATQIVIGASNERNRLFSLHKSIVEQVVHESGIGLDVHVISLEKGRTTLGDSKTSRAVPVLLRKSVVVSPRRAIAGALAALMGMPLLTLLLVQFRGNLDLSTETLLNLIGVVIVGVIGGTVASVVGAINSFLLLNYYFVKPFYTLSISSQTDLVSLVTFLVVSLVVGFLIDTAARRYRDSKVNHARSQVLNLASEILRGAKDPLASLMDYIKSLLSATELRLLQLDEETRVFNVIAGKTTIEHNTKPSEFSIEINGPSLLLDLGDFSIDAYAMEMIVLLRPSLNAAVASRQLSDERESIERARQVDELKTSLLGAVSHDLRTPLATIRAASSGLLADDVELGRNDQRELIEVIDLEATRLSDMVGNLLDMSRISAQSLPVSLVEVNLAEVVSQSLLGLSHEIDRVIIDIGEDFPCVLGDQPLLERAIANVIDNALAYSPANEKVTVSAQVEPNEIELLIVDHGSGIAYADRARVFQPFQRLSSSHIRSGVGLGLAVTKGFIEAQGGTISIRDNPGPGTTFVITLPKVQL